MLDIVAASVLVSGALYYIVKYKILFGDQKTLSLWNIVLGSLIAVVTSVYAIYLRIGHNIDSRYITATVLFAIFGTAIDLYKNVFPERGAWTAGAALSFLVKEVYKTLGSTSTEYHIGLGIAVVIGGMISISEMYKVYMYSEPLPKIIKPVPKRGLPYHANIAQFLQNEKYSD